MESIIILIWRNSPNLAHIASFLRFIYHTQLDTYTHPAGLLWTDYQLYTEVANYATHNKNATDEYPFPQ